MRLMVGALILSLPFVLSSQHVALSQEQGHTALTVNPNLTGSSSSESGVPADNKSEVEGNNGPNGIAQAVDIEFQIQFKRKQIQDAETEQRLLHLFIENEASLAKAFNDFATANCDGNQTPQLSDDYSAISQSIGIYYQLTTEIQKTEASLLPPLVNSNFWGASPIEKCKILKATVTQKSYDAVVLKASEINSNYNNRISLLRSQLGVLNDRLHTVLLNQSAIDTLTQHLPLMLGIIAGAGVVIMLIVRFFTSELQMEWVASGQVTQFTTVMILLVAIMALGLTQILREQVLGTLLGGIAGYVLAQGVGRSAARATLHAAAASLAPASAPAGSKVEQREAAKDDGNA